MASNTPARPGEHENPYFDASVGPGAPQQTLEPGALQRPPQGTATATATNPSTPAREQPPILSRPRPNVNAANAATRQQSSIGLRRLRPPRSRQSLTPVANDFEQPNPQPQPIPQGQAGGDGRRRSSSEPQRPNWGPDGVQGAHALKPLPSVPELSASAANKAGSTSGASVRRTWLPRWGSKQPVPQLSKEEKEAIAQEAEYDHRIVDLLDVVDPEVSTLTSITNLQNSLFIPSLGRFVNRRPTYDLSWAPPARRESAVPGAYPESLENIAEEERRQPEDGDQRPSAGRTYSITSHVDSTHYAALPHGATLEGWDPEDVERLDDHVRHMLHSRRSKLARSWKGFIRYASRPLGFLVTLYATLITLFGLAWVLFLIGWIEVGSKQNYLVEIIDYTLVALFAIVGDGLAPFRAVDTYHMIYIAHYRTSSIIPLCLPHSKISGPSILTDSQTA